MACEESPLWVHWEVSLVETVNILCVCICVCVGQSERGTAVGLCPGLQGGIRTTLTHTVLLLSLLFYPSHDPAHSSPFFLSQHLSPYRQFLCSCRLPATCWCVCRCCCFRWWVIEQSEGNKLEKRYLIHHLNLKQAKEKEKGRHLNYQLVSWPHTALLRLWIHTCWVFAFQTHPNIRAWKVTIFTIESWKESCP